jgi:hypothetical protein
LCGKIVASQSGPQGLKRRSCALPWEGEGVNGGSAAWRHLGNIAMIDPIAGWRNSAPKHGAPPKGKASGFGGGARRSVRENDLVAFVGLVGLTFAMLTSSVTVALVA